MHMTDSNDFEGRAVCAQAIRNSLRRGPTGSVLGKAAGGDPLFDVAPPHEKVLRRSATLRKSDRTDTLRRLADQVVTGMKKIGLVPVPLLEALGARSYNGIGDCSTFRKIHAAGAQIETPNSAHEAWLRKMALPNQSSNSRWDNATADDGATLGVQRQSVPGTKPSLLGPTHAASMNDGRPPPEDSDMDETVKALKQIHAAGPKQEL
jgi:hypothetical protein